MKASAAYILKAIGVGLFVLIILGIDTEKAVTELSTVPIAYLIGGFSLFPVIYLIKSIRWHLISSAAGAKTTFEHSLALYMSGLFLGIVTPGKVGEAAKIPALIARGLRAKDAIAVTVLDRVLDIALLGVIAIWSVGILFSWRMSFTLVLIVILTLFVIFLLKNLLRKIHDLLLPSIPLNIWLKSLLLTLVNWIVFFAQFWILAKGFGIEVPILTFIAIMTITGIVSILPIAPAGLGTRDTALLVLLGKYGVSAETIIAFSFTIFILTICASTIGAYFWLKYPISSSATE